jgi:glycosyltransferase involved in cell wall biosynthesis
MPDSVHTARWINQLSDLGWDLHLFSANPGVPHSELRNITVYNLSFSRPAGLKPTVRLRGLWPMRVGVERLSLKVSYAKWLARLIRWLQPDVVHSMEIQQAGYITLDAKAQFKGEFPPWIVANWGSDIYLFGRLAEHAEKVKSVMSACDYYTCECDRDVDLARAFGFKGKVLLVTPQAGGFDLERVRHLRQPGRTSDRRLIALKGYQGWAGRALVGLRAIELCGDALDRYQLAVYSADPAVRIAAELTSRSIGRPIEIVPRGSHEDILRLHGRARVSIGLSISDAISTSLLESILMGSFPIQSNTSCGDEWVKHGETGLLVHPEEPREIAAALRQALSDDKLVDCAAEANAQVASERLDQSIIRPKVVEIYKAVAEHSRAAGSVV